MEYVHFIDYRCCKLPPVLYVWHILLDLRQASHCSPQTIVFYTATRYDKLFPSFLTLANV